MAWPTLRAGQTNLAVGVMQDAIARDLIADGNFSVNQHNNTYGSGTVADVIRFKQTHGLTPLDGSLFGAQAWEVLKPRLKRPGDYMRLRRYWLAIRLAKERAERDRLRGAVVAECHQAWVNRAAFDYQQARPMASSLNHDSAAHGRTDCSAYATLAFKDAGAPNPNGHAYDGAGWTGTLVAHGQWTDRPRPGDLAFYGPSRKNTKHVTVFDEDATGVYSFGHTPIEHYTTPRYRDDYLGAKNLPLLKGDPIGEIRGNVDRATRLERGPRVAGRLAVSTPLTRRTLWRLPPDESSPTSQP